MNTEENVIEEDFDYKIFRMNKGFEFSKLTTTDLEYYKKVKCDEGQKMAIVDTDGQFIYIEE